MLTLSKIHSLSRIEDTLDSLNGAVWFTALNLKSDYWQVKMQKLSQAFLHVGLKFWVRTHASHGNPWSENCDLGMKSEKASHESGWKAW